MVYPHEIRGYEICVSVGFQAGKIWGKVIFTAKKPQNPLTRPAIAAKKACEI